MNRARTLRTIALIVILGGSLALLPYVGIPYVPLRTTAFQPNHLWYATPTLDLDKTVSSPTAQPGDTLTYQLLLTATDGTVNGTLTDTLPAGLTYVPGSVTDGATFTDGQIRYTGAVTPGGDVSITYQTTVDANVDSGSILYNAAFVTWEGGLLDAAATVAISDEATLLCSVNLQGRPTPPHSRWSVPLRASLSLPGHSTPAYSFTPTTDENGSFTIEGIAPGTYELWIKKSTTLQNRLTVTLTSGNNNVDCGVLREGDANNDNFVMLIDFSILAAAFGTCEGDANYNEQADFNGDGCVLMVDFSQLSINFEQAGDEPWPWPTGLQIRQQRPAIAPVNDVSIIAKTQPVQGDSVCVAIEVQAGDQPVDGAAAYLNFDPSLLQVKQITPSELLPLALQNQFDNQLGTIDVAAGAFDDFPTGTFELTEVCFDVIGDISESRIAFQFDSPRQTDVTSGGASILTGTFNEPTAVTLDSLDASSAWRTLQRVLAALSIIALIGLVVVGRGHYLDFAKRGKLGK